MIESIHVVGAGRVGTAVAARLAERGLGEAEREPELVLLCVPDRAIAEVAQALEPGPWVAHVSGATSLAALEPHTRRFGLHPLQTFTRARGPEQLDGAFAAVTAESDEARELGFWLARTLGLQPFSLADAKRDAYHAGAAIASNYLVTLRRAAGSLLEAAGAPPEALDPLMRRTIENGFELTGPIARGDWATVDAHVAAIRRERPELEAMYAELRRDDEGNPVRVVRRIAELGPLERRRRARADDGCPARRARVADRRGAAAIATPSSSACSSIRRSSAMRTISPPIRATRRRDLALAEAAGADVLFAPTVDEMYPPGFQTWVEVEELGGVLEGEHRPGHFRGVATICLKLFNIVRPRYAYFGQKDAQQVAVLRRMVRDLELDVTVTSVPTVRDADGLALSSRNARLSPAERSARSRFRARSPRATPTPRARPSTVSTWTTSRSPTSIRRCSPPPCASAPFA